MKKGIRVCYVHVLTLCKECEHYMLQIYTIYMYICMYTWHASNLWEQKDEHLGYPGGIYWAYRNENH